ncbi:MAG: diguanylate cyclase [Ruminococcaceae bacterium]|nr:diguanylate cyclase [Oscillospiraceae bacterium]
MKKTDFANLFSELAIPVVVFEATDTLPVRYMNVQAGIRFSPSHSVQKLTGQAVNRQLDDLLRFDTPEEADAFRRQVLQMGHVEHYQCSIVTFEGNLRPVALWGNTVEAEDGVAYFVAYFSTVHTDVEGVHDPGKQLSEIINASFLADNVEASIQTVLAMAGREQRVSRAYIFEEVSATTTRNTYEWCAEGVEPAIQDLQSLEKADYNYDVIMQSGMYVTDDVRTLPQGDREILETQGIRSLAIIPLFDYGKPLGYVGFDDTAHYRQWSQDELQFLKSVSSVLATLIKRRNAEHSAQRTQDIMQIMLDVSDDVVYANTLDGYTVIFVSRSLALSLGTTREALLGKPCWQVLQKDQTGPCAFCPIPKITLEPGAERSQVYAWEVENTRTCKTYLAKDSIVKWVDGQYVHVETATDISARKDYEEQLRYYASVDTMTGALNRDWAGRLLEDMLKQPAFDGSLVFIDLDGLKKVNDQFGHALGDEMITEIINTVRAGLNDNELICRWGGDEFLVWLQADPETADRRIQQVIVQLERQNQKNTRPYKLSFSYGVVAFSSAEGTTLDALVTRADELMYRNKMGKRGIAMNRRRDDTR